MILGVAKAISLVFGLLVFSTVSAVHVSLLLPNAVYQEHDGKRLPTVSAGKPFQVQVKVTDGDRDTGEVQLESTGSIKIKRTGYSTSVAFAKGLFSSEKDYTYNAVVENPGIYTIGPAKVRHNNITTLSNSVTFQVVAKPVGQNQDISDTDSDDDDIEDVLAYLVVDKKEVVVGQAFQVVLRVLTRRGVVGVDIDNIQFPGFLVEEVGKGTGKREFIDQKTYFVHEKKFLVTAVQDGMQEIGPVPLTYTVQKVSARKRNGSNAPLDFFENFFGRIPRVVRRRVHSDKVSISVEPLPAVHDRIDGVGQFSSFEAIVNQNTVKVNEPIILQLILTGHGNFERIPDPELKLPSDVRFYKSKTHITRTSSSDVTAGKKVYEFVLQPKKAGELRIAPQQFNFYNSEDRRYQTLKTREIRVSVEAQDSDGQQAQDTDASFGSERDDKQLEQPSENSHSEPLCKDIHFIEEGASASKHYAPELPLWLFILLLMIPLILCIWSLISKCGCFSSSAWYMRREKRRQLMNFTRQIGQFQVKNDAIGLYQFFLSFLSIRYDIRQNTICEQIIVEALSKNGFEEKKIREFLDYLNECASLSFASNGIDRGKHSKLIKQAEYWFLILNK